MDYGHLQRTRMLSSPKLLFSCRQGRLTWFPINFTPVYGMKLDIELHVENTEIWRECSSWDLQKKHMGIIWQQCLLIFLKNITWTFDFFYHNFHNLPLVDKYSHYPCYWSILSKLPPLSKLPRLTVLKNGGNTTSWRQRTNVGQMLASVWPTISNQFNIVGQQFANICPTFLPAQTGPTCWSNVGEMLARCWARLRRP